MTEGHRLLIADLARHAVVDRFERLGAGWSCTCHRISEGAVVKVPRGLDGARALGREVRILQRLSPDLGELLPRVLFYEAPSAHSLGFAGFTFLPGKQPVPATLAGAPRRERRGFVAEVARFLVALRGVSAQPLLRDEVVGHHRLFDDARKALLRIEARSDPTLGTAWLADVTASIDRAEHAHPALFQPRVLAHGDFGPWNLLVSRAPSTLTGVLDMGSASISDIHYDLNPLHAAFGAAFTRAVLRELGDGDLDALRPKLALFKLVDDLQVLTGMFEEAGDEDRSLARAGVESSVRVLRRCAT